MRASHIVEALFSALLISAGAVAAGSVGGEAQIPQQFTTHDSNAALIDGLKAILASVQNSNDISSAGLGGVIFNASMPTGGNSDGIYTSNIDLDADSFQLAIQSFLNEPVGNVTIDVKLPPSRIPADVARGIINAGCPCIGNRPGCCPPRFKVWQALLDFQSGVTAA